MMTFQYTRPLLPKALILPLFAMWLLGTSTSSSQDITTFYSKTDAFFSTYVQDGLVAYETLHKNPEAIDALVSIIESTDLTSLKPTDQQAFMVNAYNVLVIKQVLKHYPMQSPLDRDDFFDAKVVTLNGKQLSLNKLEKKELLGAYPDPRFHFVLVCAAIGCPVLISEAYRGDTLEGQLEAQTRLALNDSKHVRVDDATKTVHVSSLFSWYEADFTRKGSIIDYLNTYRKAPIDATYAIEHLTYDWALNTQ